MMSIMNAVAVLCILLCCSGCVAAEPSNGGQPIHVGEHVSEVGAIDVEARLIDFKEDAGFIDFVDGAVQFDVSKFVIEAPERYRGTTFLINHVAGNADEIWRHVGAKYKMQVYVDVLESSDSVIVAGPEYATIVQRVE